MNKRGCEIQKYCYFRDSSVILFYIYCTLAYNRVQNEKNRPVGRIFFHAIFIK